MGKTVTKKKHNSMDLRKRSDIIIETADIDKMSHEELVQRIKELNIKISQTRLPSDDLDFMIMGPQIRAIKKMKVAIKERLALR